MWIGLVSYVSLVLCEVLSNEPSPPNQLLDIAKGLNYLHSIHIAHGDLKGVREIWRCCSNPLTDALAKCSY